MSKPRMMVRECFENRAGGMRLPRLEGRRFWNGRPMSDDADFVNNADICLRYGRFRSYAQL